METALSHLPEQEREYLNAGPRTILDWGCASGEGVAALARSFPAHLRNFTRIHAEPLLVDKHSWPGRQLLVIYGSDDYLRDAVNRVDSMALVIAQLEAARSAERQRADATEVELKSQRQRADA